VTFRAAVPVRLEVSSLIPRAPPDHSSRTALKILFKIIRCTVCSYFERVRTLVRCRFESSKRPLTRCFAGDQLVSGHVPQALHVVPHLGVGGSKVPVLFRCFSHSSVDIFSSQSRLSVIWFPEERFSLTCVRIVCTTQYSDKNRKRLSDRNSMFPTIRSFPSDCPISGLSPAA